jgi:hypothetical protein
MQIPEFTTDEAAEMGQALAQTIDIAAMQMQEANTSGQIDAIMAAMILVWQDATNGDCQCSVCVGFRGVVEGMGRTYAEWQEAHGD